MTKKLVFKVGILVVFFGGLLATRVYALVAPPVEVTLTLPQTALDTSDLDLRDELNRPIHSAAKKAELERLFTAGLNQMILQSLTPVKAWLLARLASQWDARHGWLRAAFWDPGLRFIAVLQKNLWDILSVFSVDNFFILKPTHTMDLQGEGPSARQILLSKVISSTALLR